MVKVMLVIVLVFGLRGGNSMNGLTVVPALLLASIVISFVVKKIIERG